MSNKLRSKTFTTMYFFSVGDVTHVNNLPEYFSIYVCIFVIINKYLKYKSDLSVINFPYIINVI